MQKTDLKLKQYMLLMQLLIAMYVWPHQKQNGVDWANERDLYPAVEANRLDRLGKQKMTCVLESGTLGLGSRFWTKSELRSHIISPALNFGWLLIRFWSSQSVENARTI